MAGRREQTEPRPFQQRTRPGPSRPRANLSGPRANAHGVGAHVHVAYRVRLHALPVLPLPARARRHTATSKPLRPADVWARNDRHRRSHLGDRHVATPTKHKSVTRLLSGRTVFALVAAGRASRGARRLGLRRCSLPAVIRLVAAEAKCTSGSSTSRSCSAPELAASRNAETACSNSYPDSAHRSTGSSRASASNSNHRGNNNTYTPCAVAACSSSRRGSRSLGCSNLHDTETGDISPPHLPLERESCRPTSRQRTTPRIALNSTPCPFLNAAVTILCRAKRHRLPSPPAQLARAFPAYNWYIRAYRRRPNDRAIRPCPVGISPTVSARRLASCTGSSGGRGPTLPEGISPDQAASKPERGGFHFSKSNFL